VLFARNAPAGPPSRLALNEKSNSALSKMTDQSHSPVRISVCITNNYLKPILRLADWCVLRAMEVSAVLDLRNTMIRRMT